jgi:hypothetical protein
VHVYSKILEKTQSNIGTPTRFGAASHRTASRRAGPRRVAPDRLGVRAPRLPRRRAPQGPLKSSPSSRGVPAVPRVRQAGRTAVEPVVTVVPPCRARRPRPWALRRLDGRGRAQVQAGPPSPVAYLSSRAMAAPAPA